MSKKKEEGKGRVEFGCDTLPGDKYQPTISIGMGGLCVTFRCNVVLDSMEEAKAFTTDVFKILSSPGDVNVHKDPQGSQLTPHDGVMGISRETKKNDSTILALVDTDGFIKDEDC